MAKKQDNKKPKRPKPKKPTTRRPKSKNTATVTASVAANAAAVEEVVPARSVAGLASDAARNARDGVPVESILEHLHSKATINKRPAKRFSSGVKAIDEIFTSMGRSGLKCGIYLLVGDPGSGKSSFALQILKGMKEKGHEVAYLAYEGKDNIHECIRRIGLPEIIPVVDQEDGWAPTSEKLGELLVKVHKANKTGKPAVFTVDSVKNLNAADGSTKGRRIAIQQLMETVQRTNSIVFLVGHVSKETRGKKVKKIQGPSELEELCDVRIDFIDITPKEEKNLGYRHIMLDTSSKNRHGRPGEFQGFFLEETGFTWPSHAQEGREALDTQRSDDM